LLEIDPGYRTCFAKLWQDIQAAGKGTLQ
jgi:hypothetical protein